MAEFMKQALVAIDLIEEGGLRRDMDLILRR